jgi:hypothetical protein
MKRRILLASLVSLAFVLVHSAAAQEDPYSEATIHYALTTHVMTSFDEKELSRFGDRAAVAIIRLLSDKDLEDLDEARRILGIVQGAFSVPQNIVVPADRKPKAALFLLHWINESVFGPALATEIDSTKRKLLSAEANSKSGEVTQN